MIKRVRTLGIIYVGWVAENAPRREASQFYFDYLKEAVGTFESAIEHLKCCEYSQCDVSDAVDMAHRIKGNAAMYGYCLLYTSPSPRDKRQSRMPSSA